MPTTSLGEVLSLLEAHTLTDKNEPKVVNHRLEWEGFSRRLGGFKSELQHRRSLN